MKKRVARKVIKAGMDSNRQRYSTYLKATIIEPDYYSYVSMLFHGCNIQPRNIRSKPYPITVTR